MAILSTKDGNAHVLTEGKAIVIFNSATTLGTIGTIKKEKDASGNEIKIKAWGTDNDAPTSREKLLRGSAVAPALVTTKRNMVLGKQFYCYLEQPNAEGDIIEKRVPTPPEIDAFMKASGGNGFFRKAANSLFIHGNIFAEFKESLGTAAGVTMQSGNKYAAMKLQPARYIRAEKMDDDGIIQNYFWRGDAWQKRSDEQHDFLPKKIAAYNPDLEFQEGDFLYATGDDLFSDEYYNIPSWEGCYKFMQIAEVIPDFHKNNMEGILIRYLVEISNEVYGEKPDEFASEADVLAWETAKTAKKQEILDKLEEFLSTSKGGRAFVAHFDVDREMKQIYPYVKIAPINIDLKDKALLDLLEEAHRAIMSSFQVHSTLANINTQGQLSSGNEMRNAYLVWLAIHATTFRDIILEFLYVAAAQNGWNPLLKFGFKDMVLTTLSDNPTGQKPQPIGGE
jgi:hypothetical protein